MGGGGTVLDGVYAKPMARFSAKNAAWRCILTAIVIFFCEKGPVLRTKACLPLSLAELAR